MINHGKRFAQGKVYINTIGKFWAFAKEGLIKFHGISEKYFPLCFKGMEFRYNYRDQNIFELLIKYLCNLVQDCL